MRDTANHIKNIREKSWKILYSIERNLRRYERCPIEIIVKDTKFNRNFIINTVRQLSLLGWVEYFEQPYQSVRLLTSGIDAIALHLLAKKDIVVGIGRKIGVGKESDIYEAIGPNKEMLSLKIFRLGRISFKDIIRKRDYNIYSTYKPGWILRNYIAAKKEFNVLKILYRNGVSVPKPITHIKHIIVMEKLQGDILVNIKDLKNPFKLLNEILLEIKRAYELNIINGDLSPFNIFISNLEKPILIDWPQAIPKDREQALSLLARDIKNIIKFFNNKYNLTIDIEKVFKKLFGLSINKI